MKKVMFIGTTGSGKTTLIQKLENEELVYKKTQSVDYVGRYIDTPGEYMENRQYYTAIMVLSYDADIVCIVQDATKDQQQFSSNFGSVFQKKVIGIITKIDQPGADIERSRNFLNQIVVDKIIETSSYNGTGIEDLIYELDN